MRDRAGEDAVTPGLRRQPRLAPVLLALPVVISVPLVLGFLGALHPAFDAFTHFRAHLAVLMALLALPLVFMRGMRLVGAAAIALGVGAFVTTVDMARGDAPPAATGPAYTLLQLNLRYDNETPEKVLSLIGRVQPDVITLQEVSAAWRPRIEALKARYPHAIICPAPSRIGGVALLSRRPFAEGGAAECHDRGAFALAAIDFGAGKADIAALHLGWPWPFGQHWQIGTLSGVLAGLGERAVVAGDFNAVRWSDTVGRVARLSQLRPLGIGPTYMMQALPDVSRRHAGLPIDQILVGDRIAVTSVERLGDAGSDHLPVLMTFGFADGPPNDDAEKEIVLTRAE